MYLIVGLGNPGTKYNSTRHNIGFEVLDAFFDEFTHKAKLHGDIAEKRINNAKVIGLKPTTFMNASGHAVAATASFYKIPTENILVVHDELDLPFGQVKLQNNRGPAGHNGVASVIEHLGTKDFSRVRIGIIPQGKEKSDIEMESFVLKKWTASESKKIPEIMNISKEYVLSFLEK